MYLKVGQSLTCPTDTTTVLVIKAAEVDVSLTCGGAEMADLRSVGDRVPIADGATAAAELGKRYIDMIGPGRRGRRLLGSHVMNDESVVFALAQEDLPRKRAAYWTCGLGMLAAH